MNRVRCQDKPRCHIVAQSVATQAPRVAMGFLSPGSQNVWEKVNGQYPIQKINNVASFYLPNLRFAIQPFLGRLHVNYMYLRKALLGTRCCWTRPDDARRNVLIIPTTLSDEMHSTKFSVKKSHEYPAKLSRIPSCKALLGGTVRVARVTAHPGDERRASTCVANGRSSFRKQLELFNEQNVLFPWRPRSGSRGMRHFRVVSTKTRLEPHVDPGYGAEAQRGKPGTNVLHLRRPRCSRTRPLNRPRVEGLTGRVATWGQVGPGRAATPVVAPPPRGPPLGFCPCIRLVS